MASQINTQKFTTSFLKLKTTKVGLIFYIIIAHDILVAGVSFPIAVLMRVWDDPVKVYAILPMLLYGTLLFMILSMLVFYLFGVHRAFWRYSVSSSGLFPILKAVTCVVALFVIILPLLDDLIAAPRPVPRAVPLIQWFVLVSLLGGSRLAYATLIVPTRKARTSIGLSKWEPILIVGTNSTAALLIQFLRWPTRSHFEVVGLLDDRPRTHGRSIYNVPVLGPLTALPEAAARLLVHGVTLRRVVLSLSPGLYDEVSIAQLRAAAKQLGLKIHQADEFILLAAAEEKASDMRLRVSPTVERPTFFAFKRITDFAVGVSLLALVLPLIIIIAVMIWASLGHPVIFYQVRPGKDFGPITVYKFRTLRRGHTPDGCVLSDDSRRTRLGNLLRRTRLDELPQLWNVIRGDMSLIGPRPLLPRDLPELGEAACERLSVRPGITGWAQVNGGHQLTSSQKIALDLWYIRHHSLWLDLKILARTLHMMVFGERIDELAIKRAELVTRS